MTTITASAVKELREITGVAMMDCKKALVETNGNMEEAKNFLRKKGQAKALKKSSRETREGAVGFSSSEDGKTAGLVQVTCETDFVARNEKFQEFIKKLADQVSVNGENDLLQQNLINGEGNVEGMLTDTIAELGENMQILNSRKFKINHGLIGGYIHSNGKIGVAVPMETDQPCDDDRLKSLAKDIAMHIAAFQAEAVKPDQVPEEVLEKEKEVFTAQARESGKPENIIEKMIEGRLKKYVKEICVESQPFVKDPQFSVSQIVEQTAKELGVKINFDTFEKYQF
ncbi:MAG: translation elongation factor Ts [SAR324 cluster bacterium]|jgi:elongation factor Ts|nr:translation elongation factor Ts [SAR324 cluster bacterium]